MNCLFLNFFKFNIFGPCLNSGNGNHKKQNRRMVEGSVYSSFLPALKMLNFWMPQLNHFNSKHCLERIPKIIYVQPHTRAWCLFNEFLNWGHRNSNVHNVLRGKIVFNCLWFYMGWYSRLRGFPSGSVVKNLPAAQEAQEMWVWSLCQEDLLEKGIATHPSILAWRIPWTEEPGWLQSVGLQRVRRDWKDTAGTHVVDLKVVCVFKLSCSVTSDSFPLFGLQPTRILCPWNFQARILSGFPFPTPGDLLPFSLS